MVDLLGIREFTLERNPINVMNVGRVSIIINPLLKMRKLMEEKLYQ